MQSGASSCARHRRVLFGNRCAHVMSDGAGGGVTGSRGPWRQRERGGGDERASDSVSTGCVCGVTASPSQSVAVVLAQPAAPRWLMRLSGHTLPTTLLRRPHSTQPRPPQPPPRPPRPPRLACTQDQPGFPLGYLCKAIIVFARHCLCFAKRWSKIRVLCDSRVVRAAGSSLQTGHHHWLLQPSVACATPL